MVRELHVYGSVVPVSERNVDKFQHQGYGMLLMYHAEKIAVEEHKSTKIAVISGVGTRKYYRKLGYELKGPYMVKSLLVGEYKSSLEFSEEKCNQFVNKIPPVQFQSKKTDEDYFKQFYVLNMN